MEKFKFLIGQADSKKRIDHYLAEQEELGLTRSRIQQLLTEGVIILDGNPTKANHKLEIGETIVAEIPLPKLLQVEPEEIPLDIVYEDSDLLVVNKPQGMVVHPACGNDSGTLVNALLFHCRDLSGVGGVIRPGIVHRLDKDTSGLLMIAKNDLTHLALAEQIKARTVEKIYLALVHGRVKQEQGTVNAPIGRHPSDRKRMAVHFKGRSAITHYQVQHYLGDFTYLRVQLETGRTHQIRVHLAHLGHPIVGDPVYSRNNKFHLPGQFLHAHSLKFIHPRSGEEMMFTAPLPPALETLLEKLIG